MKTYLSSFTFTFQKTREGFILRCIPCPFSVCGLRYLLHDRSLEFWLFLLYPKVIPRYHYNLGATANLAPFIGNKCSAYWNCCMLHSEPLPIKTLLLNPDQLMTYQWYYDSLTMLLHAAWTLLTWELACKFLRDSYTCPAYSHCNCLTKAKPLNYFLLCEWVCVRERGGGGRKRGAWDRT